MMMLTRKGAAAIVCASMAVVLSIAAANATQRVEEGRCDNDGRCISFTAPVQDDAPKGRQTKRMGLGSIAGCPQSLGCGCNAAARFLGLSASEALKRGLYVARLWARIGTPASKGCIGCIAVLTRKGGGHVGKVVGYDARGNPRIESYANRRLGWTTAVYPSRRVIVYRSIVVMASAQ